MEDEDQQTSKEVIAIRIHVQTQLSQPAHALQFPDSWSHTEFSFPVGSAGIPKINSSFSVSETIFAQRRKIFGIPQKSNCS